MTLKDVEGVKIFWQISIITLERFDLNDRICRPNTDGRSIFLGVSHVSIPRRRDPSAPKIVFVTYLCYLRPNSLTWSNEIWRVR